MASWSEITEIKIKNEDRMLLNNDEENILRTKISS